MYEYSQSASIIVESEESLLETESDLQDKITKKTKKIHEQQNLKDKLKDEAQIRNLQEIKQEAERNQQKKSETQNGGPENEKNPEQEKFPKPHISKESPNQNGNFRPEHLQNGQNMGFSE